MSGIVLRRVPSSGTHATGIDACCKRPVIASSRPRCCGRGNRHRRIRQHARRQLRRPWGIASHCPATARPWARPATLLRTIYYAYVYAVTSVARSRQGCGVFANGISSAGRRRRGFSRLADERLADPSTAGVATVPLPGRSDRRPGTSTARARLTSLVERHHRRRRDPVHERPAGDPIVVSTLQHSATFDCAAIVPPR
jgi:hypothetical protein